MGAVKKLFGGGAPKQPKIDTSAQDAALALQQKQQAKLDAETAARSRAATGRNRGRQLLTFAGTGDLGVQGKSATLG